mmetsp:Transcript_79265/g.230177  ORF Transcript_79265/g.230177 Transcript_79265/m.230177 type:complete len:236 (+) Transcript_79265:59-766(+)
MLLIRGLLLACCAARHIAVRAKRGGSPGSVRRSDYALARGLAAHGWALPHLLPQHESAFGEAAVGHLGFPTNLHREFRGVSAGIGDNLEFDDFPGDDSTGGTAFFGKKADNESDCHRASQIRRLLAKVSGWLHLDDEAHVGGHRDADARIQENALDDELVRKTVGDNHRLKQVAVALSEDVPQDLVLEVVELLGDYSERWEPWPDGGPHTFCERVEDRLLRLGMRYLFSGSDFKI